MVRLTTDFSAEEAVKILSKDAEPWCKLYFHELVLHLGLTHCEGGSVPSGKAYFQYAGPDADNTCIVAFFEDGRRFPNTADTMFICTHTQAKNLRDESSVMNLMLLGLYSHIVGLAKEHGLLNPQGEVER